VFTIDPPAWEVLEAKECVGVASALRAIIEAAATKHVPPTRKSRREATMEID
jgi:hypothetical protein